MRDDEIQRLIDGLEAIRLDGVDAGPQQLSLRRLHLSSAVTEVAARLVGNPEWEPTAEDLVQIGLLILAMEEAAAGEPGDAFVALHRGRAFVNGVRRQFGAYGR